MPNKINTFRFLNRAFFTNPSNKKKTKLKKDGKKSIIFMFMLELYLISSLLEDY